jgi:hypothetical protein
MSNGSSGLDESASVLFAYAAPEIEQSKVLFDEDQHDVTIFYSLEETLVMSPTDTHTHTIHATHTCIRVTHT